MPSANLEQVRRDTDLARAELLLLEPNQEHAALILKAVHGANATVVQQAAEVLEFLRGEGPFSDAPRPDLVVLDLDLSKIQDCKMLAFLKRDPRFRRIPVVVLAESLSHQDIFEAYDLHANAYIGKPAKREEFSRALRATLYFWLHVARLPKH